MRRVLILILLSYSIASNSQELQVIVPVQIDQNVLNGDNSSNVTFYEMEYISDSINLKSIKSIYKDLSVPDYIKINAPDLSKFNDRMILLAVINNKQSADDLVIWLAGNYQTNSVTFFIDRTLDRNFNNDGKPIVIKPRHGNVKVEFKPRGEKRRSSLYLSVPKKSDDSFGMQQIKLAKRKERIVNQFSLEAMAGTGVGRLDYSYDNTVTGFPGWYDVKFSIKNIGIMLNYDTHRFKFGLGLQYFNYFYFTSYTNLRIAAPENVFTSTGFRTIDNVKVDRNIDNQSTNVLQYSAMLAYKLKLSSTVFLQPNIAVGLNHYLPNKFLPNRTETLNGFEMGLKQFIELGLRIEFVVGKDRAVFLGFAANTYDWDPIGFKESLSQENFESSLLTVRGMFGYRIGF